MQRGVHVLVNGVELVAQEPAWRCPVALCVVDVRAETGVALSCSLRVSPSCTVLGMAVQETGVAPPHRLRVSLSRFEGLVTGESRELAAQCHGLSAQGCGMTGPVRTGSRSAGTVAGVGRTVLTVRYGGIRF